MSRKRSQARLHSVQALYQWQLNQQAAKDIVLQFAADKEHGRADHEFFRELVCSVIDRREELDSAIAELSDRDVAQLDPVEHAILLIGIYELTECQDVPYRVVINEAVELAKTFGAEKGHRYVNGVLDKAARALRPLEAAAGR